MKKNLTFLTFGSILEYYDLAIYLFLAKQIGASLIPANNSKINLLITFSIYAAGGLIRPLGGLCFGYFGDKYSRKNSFNNSILIMALSTLLMGLIPSYQTIGIFSVILLITLRFTQSFAVGGEIPAAMVYAYEIAPQDKKPFYTNIAVCGTNIGLFLAAFTCEQLNKYLTSDIVWRYAFIIGGCTGLIFALLRKQLQEPVEFTSFKNSNQDNNHSPFKQLLTNHKKQLVNALSFSAFIACVITVFVSFMPSFLQTFYNIPINVVMHINSNSIFIFLLCSLFAGKFYYLFTRKFFLYSIIVFIGVSYWIFNSYGNITTHELAIIHYTLFVYLGLIAGRLPVILNNMFPINIRYTGVSLAYNLAFGIIGSVTQIVLLSLVELSDIKILPAVYIMVFALIAWIFFYRTTDTQLNKHKES